MDTTTMDMLYLEISQFTKAKTSRELELEKNAISNDERIVSGLILDCGDGTKAKISSGLSQDFVNNTHSFETTDNKGDVYSIIIKVSAVKKG